MTYTFDKFIADCRLAGIAFRHPKQANYYWNLWVETMVHDNKVGAEHDFGAYATWMKKRKDPMVPLLGVQ